jgi:hypothetical protein
MVQTIQIKKGVQIELDDLISSLSELDEQALRAFFEKLNHRIARPEPQRSQQQQEMLLLKQIRAMIPRSAVMRLKALQKKRHAETISPKEISEMRTISDFLEMKSAERVYLVGALAQLRQTSITEVAKQLNLKKIYG